MFPGGKYTQLGRRFQDKILGLKCLNSFMGLSLQVHLPIEKKLCSYLCFAQVNVTHIPQKPRTCKRSHFLAAA